MIKKIIDLVKNSQIPEANKYYWKYQFELGEDHLVPYLAKQGCFFAGDAVCEIGSAEGGALHALMQAGASYGLGTDISVSRIEVGAEISKLADLNVEYVEHNILTEPLPEDWVGKFDLVLLRDVIEHLEDTELALRNIHRLIKPGGFLFLTFPPYNSPFGGHQHTLAGNFFTKLPYIHLLPNAIFHKLIASGRENDIWEVKRLKNIALDAGKLTKAALNTDYSVFKQEYYLLRPVFKMKFGLPPVKITPLARLPLVRNFFSLEAAFILKKNAD